MKIPWLTIISIALWVAHFTAYPSIPFWLCVSVSVLAVAGLVVALGIVGLIGAAIAIAAAKE